MENRYVRKINLFNPDTDLAVDGQDVVIKKKKRPVNPADGLLDGVKEEKVIPAGRKAQRTQRAQPRGRAAEAPAASSAPEPAAAPASSHGTAAPAEQPIVGEAPDAIMDDFPEPIDL